jgi:hypothetical protein
LKEVVDRQPDKDDAQRYGNLENFLLDAPLRGISAAGLSESAAQTAAASLLHQNQPDDGD